MNHNIHRYRRVPCRNSSRGVGLLEVLVAMVVVSFGVLGLAGMQLTGMKHSAGGYTRSKAVLFADNMVARMRLNPDAVLAGEYDSFNSSADVTCGTKPVPYCQVHAGTAAASCSADEMADFDKFVVSCGNWYSAGMADNGLISELGNGRMQINCDDAPCTADSYYTLLVSWTEDTEVDVDGDGTSLDARRVQVRFNP